MPFFLSPTIGGSQTLRSYRALRFRDASYVLFNADTAGKPSPASTSRCSGTAATSVTRPRAVRLDEFKTGWGFGLRFNTNKNVLMRVDVGLGGPEGARLFWKFSPVF